MPDPRGRRLGPREQSLCYTFHSFKAQGLRKECLVEEPGARGLFKCLEHVLQGFKGLSLGGSLLRVPLCMMPEASHFSCLPPKAEILQDDRIHTR